MDRGFVQRSRYHCYKNLVYCDSDGGPTILFEGIDEQRGKRKRKSVVEDHLIKGKKEEHKEVVVELQWPSLQGMR